MIPRLFLPRGGTTGRACVSLLEGVSVPPESLAWTTLASTTGSAARSTTDGQTTIWDIETDLIRLRLRWSPDLGLHLDHLKSTNGAQLDGMSNSPVFALSWSGPSTLGPLTSAKLIGCSSAANGTHITLSIHLELAPLIITVNIRCHDNLAVVQQWLDIQTTEAGTLRNSAPCVLTVASAIVPTLSTVAGVQQQGGWRPDSGEYRSFRLEERLLSEPYTGESGIRSTWDETAWYAMANLAAHPASPSSSSRSERKGSGEFGSDSDTGIFSGLEYSGRWRLDATYDNASEAVRATLSPVGNDPDLVPGVTWTSPIAFLGAFTGDLDAAAATQYDFHRAVLSPPLPADFPWVQYNTWYSYFCDLDHTTLAEEVKIAADVGVEIFYLDAGWWAGSPKNDRRDLFTTGLGHWVENRDKFPEGLKGFADLVRSHGIHPGIWVEPERVDLRTASVASWKPEWIATHSGQYIGPDWPPDTNSAWLCFGNPEVQDWAIDWVGNLVDSIGARWLKWDSNYWGVCDNPDHGHGIGNAESAQLNGVYIVLDALRARFPGVIIENCAGGGTRMDFGFASKTHTAWVSDATDPPQRVRAHMAGATYLFPPSMLNTWLVESRYEGLDRHDLPDPVLRAHLRSRMLGAFGISCKMTRWTAQTRRIVTDEIAAFKQYRHLLKDGYIAHLLPQPILDSATLKPPSAWEAFQFHDGAGAEAVVLAFRNLSLSSEQLAEVERARPHGDVLHHRRQWAGGNAIGEDAHVNRDRRSSLTADVRPLPDSPRCTKRKCMTVRLATGGTIHGLDAVTLDNDVLQITVLPQLGGRIWSMIHLPTGRELLWHNPQLPPALAPFGTGYETGWAGGWDEIFPSDAPAEIEGVAYPDHGEIWSLPADLDVIEASPERVVIKLVSEGPVTGARFEKWLTLEPSESILRLRYVIHNRADAPLRFLWKPHASLALRGPARLDLPARRVIVDREVSIGFTASEAQWPYATGPNGQVDLRQVPAGDSQLVHFFDAVELDAGWCAVTHTDERIGFALCFDSRILPYVCVFGAYGEAQGVNTIITEPCTAYPYRLDQAIAQTTVGNLAPGGTLDTEILAIVYTGLDQVSHVTPAGAVIA